MKISQFAEELFNFFYFQGEAWPGAECLAPAAPGESAHLPCSEPREARRIETNQSRGWNRDGWPMTAQPVLKGGWFKNLE